MIEPNLAFSPSFWEEHLPPGEVPLTLELKIHLIFSLLIFLGVPLHRLLFWIFSSPIAVVKDRASNFFRYQKHATDKDEAFYPGTLYRLWHKNWPRARFNLHGQIVQPCAEEIAVRESDAIIQEPALKISTSKLTMAGIRELMKPAKLLGIIQNKAPFMFACLRAFTTAPNAYRKRKLRKEAQSGHGGTSGQGTLGEGEDEAGFLDDSDEEVDVEAETDEEWRTEFPGFLRNPIYAIMVAICMLAFVRNRATNILALPLGMFMKISGTSERVLTLLSNIGLIVSSRTVERIKERISVDAVNVAVELLLSPTLCFIIFDNINLYLRKFQERISNRHSMIHATNAAVIAIPGVDTDKAEDLEAMLKLRGQRINASFDDIRPTEEDGTHMAKMFECLIAELLVRYTPGSGNWTGRAEMLKKIEADMPQDRPLEAEKSDTRPFGVLNVNEGSKKGIIQVFEELQKKSTLSEEEWSAKVRIVQGDWLTSNNLRNARRERKDDVDSMERLEYLRELSALWHFALNASHMLVRTHFGNAITDPSSLAAHKGLLRRTWDALKPNYAAAKALIRHSLIARILRSVMVLLRLESWSALSKWKPTYEEVRRVARQIQQEYTLAAKARAAQDAGDEVLAHDIYFMRDALLFLVFEHAVSTADAGVVLRVLKFWAFSFRGASQHNYARECVEILLTWKYELTDELRNALERSWFVNRWGLPRRWIAADLYLEQCNFWVKRVFIASGSGVTIDYIMRKGSACVEAFRDMAHLMANFFGDADRSRRSKELAFQEDMRVLVEEMTKNQSHILSKTPRPVPAPAPKGKKTVDPAKRSAIFDVMDAGAAIWQKNFRKFVESTAYDPALGYPMTTETGDNSHDDRLDNGTAFDSCRANVLEKDNYVDLHGDETAEGGDAGALGGGDEFATGTEAF